MQDGLPATNNRRLFQKLFPRFLTAYFVIYALPFPLGYLPFTHTLHNGYYAVFDTLISWTGKYIFHISFLLVPTKNGSGDTTYNYVQLFLFIIVALLVTVAYNLFDSQKKNKNAILYWTIVYLRYWLAFSMMKYGFEKIIKSQFPFPFYHLATTYGESSPMGLMWSFMGYSTVYNVFTGLIEVGAGFFLFFRKWTLFGALLSIAVLTNIVVLNFCFDVPVKLHATHLLLLSVFIAAPDIKRLINFFFRNKAVPAVPTQIPLNATRVKAIRFPVKVTLILYFMYVTAMLSWKKYLFSGDGSFAKTPLFGIYHVEQFIRNKDTLLPLLTDTSQWKMLILSSPKQAIIQTMNDTTKTFRCITDTAGKTIRLYSVGDSTYKALLSYSVPDSSHLVISGRLKDDSVRILLQKQDVNKLELVNRKFHWITESPYKK